MEHLDVAVIGGGESGRLPRRPCGSRGWSRWCRRPPGGRPALGRLLRQPHPVFPARYSSLPGLPVGERVSEVRADERVRAGAGERTHLTARAAVAATGGFGKPNRTALPGLLHRDLLHVTDYRAPEPFAGQCVSFSRAEIS